MKKTIAVLLTVATLCAVFAGIAGAVLLISPSLKTVEPARDIDLPISSVSKFPVDFGKVEYPTPEAEAVVAVAKAWLLRGQYTQYNDKRFSEGEKSNFERYTEAPEDATSQHIYYTSCSPFTDDVFYQALGIKISKTAAQEARDKNMQIFSVEPANVKTDEERARIQKEFFEVLKPGDLIAYARTSVAGHIMLYIGNGYMIHATGASYAEEQNRDNKEGYGSVRWTTVDELFTEGEHNYLWDSLVFSILSPYKAYDCKITEQTKVRLEKMQDIYAEKICTYGEGQTVDIGEEITYTFFLHNYRNTAADIEICDTVPSGTTYIAGAQSINGVIMKWSVTVPAGESATVSYTVKVKDDESLYGAPIQSWSTVNDLDVNARKIYIGKALSADTQSKLIDALKAAEGSTVTGTALVNEIYAKAGIQLDLPAESELIEGFFKANGSTFDLVVNGEYGEMLAPGLYGGYLVNTNKSLGYERAKDLYFGNLLVGDILITKEDDRTRVYVYAGDELVFDMNPRVSEMLSPYSSELALMTSIGADKFVVLRPSLKRERTLPMPAVLPYVPGPEGEVEYPSKEAEALIVVAKAYLARASANQYEDSYFTSKAERWFEIFKSSPEDATSQINYNSSCSPFIKDVVYQAWGIDMTTSQVWTAAQMAKTKEYSMWSYVPNGNETREQQERIKNEFLSILQPGDMIALCHNGPSGHILLYVGNGYAIHCSYYGSKGGGNYDHGNNQHKWEVDGSVEYRKIDTFFNEGNYYYFWEKEIWSIMRLTDYHRNIKITDQTKLRMENLQNIYVEKISSHPTGITADLGEEITFGFYLRNDRDTAVTLEIKDTVPEGTTYITGAQKKNGDSLSWSVTLAPKARQMVCYTVRVNNDNTLYNTAIHSDSTVGGVYTNCPDIYITKTLTTKQQKQIYDICRLLDTFVKDPAPEIAEKVYERIGLTIDLPYESTLISSIFEGKKSEYTLDMSSKCYKMVVPTLYGGYRTYGEVYDKGERTRNFHYNMMIGDLLVFKEGSLGIYMYAGDGQLADLENRTLLSETESKKIMTAVFGRDMWAVLRPVIGAQ